MARNPFSLRGICIPYILVNQERGALGFSCKPRERGFRISACSIEEGCGTEEDHRHQIERKRNHPNCFNSQSISIGLYFWYLDTMPNAKEKNMATVTKTMQTRKENKMTPYQKEARKRAKKFLRAINDEARKSARITAVQANEGDNISYGENNQDVEIMQEPENHVEEGEGTSHGSNNPEQASRSSRRRGPTKCRIVATESNERLPIYLNMKGQPIGKNSIAYSTILGTISRDIAPITFPSWLKVPQHLKEKMWTIVKQKFIVPEHAKKLTLKMIGKNWRGYKVRLRKHFYDIYENNDERIANCPLNVKLEDWKAFVAYVSTEDYKNKRKKAKDVMNQHKLPHTCSRKGYARLEEEMKLNNTSDLEITRAALWVKAHTKKSGEPINNLAQEKIEKLNETTSSIACGKDDALSQVLGPDPHGRMRGVGYGITSATFFGVQQSSTRMHQLEETVKILENKLSSVNELLAKVLDLQTNGSIAQPSHKTVPEDENVSTESNRVSDLGGNSLRCVKCVLHRLTPDDIVATGIWYTDDPTTQVHHVPLGSGFSKVLIETAMKGDAILVRGNDELKTIEDAVGTFVAWPTSFIIKE